MSEKAPQAASWRRRVAPVILVAGLALIGAQLCDQDSTEVELRFDFGAAAPQVREIRVDYVTAETGERVGYTMRRYGESGASGPHRHRLLLESGAYELQIEVALPAGSRQLRRRLHVSEASVTTFDLFDELQ